MYTTNKKLTNGRIRLDYIDALRGLAALMVLVCHSTQVDQSLILPTTLAHSLESHKYGVQLFFVISALTIFYSLHRNDANAVNFFIRRFFRIAPLYFLAVAIYSWMYQQPDIKGIGLNLTFLHGFSPRYINSIVPGGWSIGVEIMFYCMIPVLFWKVVNLKRALYFFLATLIFSFVSMYVYRKLFTSTPDLESFVYFWLPNQLPVFALGFIVYYISFARSGSDIKDLFVPCVLLTLLVIFCLLTKVSVFNDLVVFGIAAATLIILISKAPLPGLVNKVTLFLGKISYSLYLCQYAAIYLVQKSGFASLLPGKSGFAAVANICLNLFLLLLTACVISTTLYHLIELPFQQMGRRFLMKKTSAIAIHKSSGGLGTIKTFTNEGTANRNEYRSN